MSAGDIRIDYEPLSAVLRAPRNPKLHAAEQLDASIGRFGFVQPLLVDERTGRLVAGHGRLEALQALRAAGKPPPDRVKVDGAGEWLVPVVRGVAFADDREAEAYVVADNRLVELGGWDDATLAAMLSDLVVGDALSGSGFSAEEAERAIAAAAPIAPPGEFPRFDLDLRVDHKCPKCGYEWSGGEA